MHMTSLDSQARGLATSQLDEQVTSHVALTKGGHAWCRRSPCHYGPASRRGVCSLEGILQLEAWTLLFFVACTVHTPHLLLWLDKTLTTVFLYYNGQFKYD